jgi:hypothetical protein
MRKKPLIWGILIFEAELFGLILMFRTATKKVRPKANLTVEKYPTKGVRRYLQAL